MKINLFCAGDTKMRSVTNLKWFEIINLTKQLKPKSFFTFYYHEINNRRPEEPKKNSNTPFSELVYSATGIA